LSLGSPVPARIMPVEPHVATVPGCTVNAPMLIEASCAPLKAPTASVSGLKTTCCALEAPALFASHTPPPVVPT